MDRKEQFFHAVKEEMTLILATSDGGRVTMRAVSPVCYDGGILIFTSPASEKYRQLAENPQCCGAVGSFYVEARAELRGSCLLPENEALRAAYCEKFPGAFDEGVEMGGREADFVLLRPIRLTGWAFENDVPDPSGIPTIPFDIVM